MVYQSCKKNGNPYNGHIGNTRNDNNNNTSKKITVIGDSIVKLLQSYEMSPVYNTVNVM